MPFAFVLFGIVLLVAGVRKQQDQLLSLLKADFTGQKNFAYWVAAIFALGAIGYLPQLKPVSHALLALVLIVLLLSNKGFFGQLTSAINSTTTAAKTSTT